VACLRHYERHHGGIKIAFGDSSRGEDLAEFLQGLCFEVERANEQTLEVRFRDPIPTDDRAARLELDLYLRVWQAMNPDTWAARAD
jgi:hypothetical protein